MMIDAKQIKKILIVQTAFIGDVILVTPLISAAKELFPNAMIDVMVIPQASNVLENNPHINSLILFDKRKNKFAAFFKTLGIIKKKQYDLALTPHSSITTAILLALGGITHRIGFARYAAQKFLTHKLPHIKNRLKIEKNLHLLSAISDKMFPIQTEIFPTQIMKEMSEQLLSEIKLNTKKVVAVAPGSNWFTKRWPLENYKELVQKLNKLNYGVVFIGSGEEHELCESILPATNSINLAGKLSLLESSAVIGECDLMVCNDSGAMHLANAMKTDVLVFFGPTVQRIGYFPIRENDHVFEVELECRPCSSHGTKSCPLEHHNCMKNILPDVVLKKVVEKLGTA